MPSNIDELSLEQLQKLYNRDPKCPGCGKVCPRKHIAGFMYVLKPEPDPKSPEKKACCDYKGGIPLLIEVKKEKQNEVQEV